MATEVLASKNVEAASILDEYSDFANTLLESAFSNASPQMVSIWETATDFVLGLFGGWDGIIEELAKGVEFKETWSQWWYGELPPAGRLLWDLGPTAQIDKWLNRDPEKPWTIREFLSFFGPGGFAATAGYDMGTTTMKTVQEGATRVGEVLGSIGSTLAWVLGGVVGLALVGGLVYLAAASGSGATVVLSEGRPGRA